MRTLRAVTALVLTLAAPSHAAEPRSIPSNDPRPRSEMLALGTSSEYPVVLSGERAPDFNYQVDGQWFRLHDLLTQGHVLLVLGAGEPQLRALEAQRAELLRLDVVPVGVLDMRAGRCGTMVRKLGLGYTVIADPTRVIGAQFNALEPHTRLTAPAWFIVDRTGTVRALGRLEWPTAEWREVAMRSLGLALDDAPIRAAFGGR